MLQPLLCRTWALRGQTPIVTAWDRHDRLTCITALTLNPSTGEIGQYFKVQRHNAKASDFLSFLIELKTQIKSKLIVIWDRLSAHRRVERLFQDCGFGGIRFESLPAYSPELNPVEHVWCTTKWGRLANWVASDIEDLNNRLDIELRQQARQQSILKSHFKLADLKTDCLRRRQ